MGFPIRKSADQRLFAPPHGLSQRTTSFIASQHQGIHRTPLRHLIVLMIDVRRLGGDSIVRKTSYLPNAPGNPRGYRDNMRHQAKVDASEYILSLRCGLNPPAQAPAKLSTFLPGRSGGARRDRTDDLMLAKHALSQLSYGPVGTRSLEAPSYRRDPPSLGRDGGPGTTRTSDLTLIRGAL